MIENFPSGFGLPNGFLAPVILPMYIKPEEKKPVEKDKPANEDKIKTDGTNDNWEK